MQLTCLEPCSTSGTPRKQPVKLQGAKYKSTEISSIKFLKHASIRHHFKDTILVNLATVSDFQNALQRKLHKRLLGHHQATENPSHFYSQREELHKSYIGIKWITNLWWSSSDDTHRTSCYTIHVCFVW